MNLLAKTFLVALVVLPACAKNAAPTTAPAEASAGPFATAAQRQKLAAHMADHVQYPADRDAVLTACAHTPEFTATEKDFVADRLPAGEYHSADEVMTALSL